MAKVQGPLSGFRDLLSAQMIAREKVLDIITSTYELYGFMPIKTPAIELFETLNGKYGDEAKTLIYDFEDRGKRHLALRYDHTVPLARLMAMQGQSLPSPYKRYVIGDVWRGESPQAGRYREFTQIDADIVGTYSFLSDAEIIAMMDDVFSALKLEVEIRVNDRRILNGLANSAGVTKETDFHKFVTVIDKVGKVGASQVTKEIEQLFGSKAKKVVSDFLSNEQTFDSVLKLLNNEKTSIGLENLENIMNVLKPLKLKNVIFDPTIARGLNYYTSTIFETLIVGNEGLGSVCAGGRYDDLIRQLGGPDSPVVGTSIGLDRLMEGLSSLNSEETKHTKTVIYISNLDSVYDADRLAIAHELRKANIPTELIYSEAKLGKQLESIDKMGVNLVIIYGKAEHQKGIVLVKDLANSTQQEVAIDDLVAFVNNLI